MDIGEIIAKLRNGLNPDAAIVEAAAPPGMPPVPPSGPPVAPDTPVTRSPAPSGPPGPPPVAAAPQGAQTPITNPTPAAETPRTMRSPPDLANMYLKLVSDNKNAAALDSGATLIAAGFSNRPENRSALIQGAMGQKPGTSLTANDIINLQKQQVENQALAIRQAAKGGLMKRYNLDRDSLDYLDASGKLDEVIKHHNTQNLVQGIDAATGQNAFYNATTGAKVADIGGVKPPTTQFVEGPQGPELRRMDTGGQVAPPLGAKPQEDQVKLTQINEERSKAGQAPITMEEYLTTVKRDKPEPNATDKAALEQINTERKAAGKPPLAMEEYIKTVKRDPQQAANAADQAAVDAINADRKLEGKPAITMEQYLTKIKRQGVTVNVGPQGQQFPTPKEGFDYRRNEDGTVYVNPDTKEPEQYPIKGGVGADVAVKAHAEGEEAVRKEREAAEKKAKAGIQKVMTANNVTSAVDRALELVGKPGVTGFGNKLMRAVSPGGLPSDSYDAAVATVSANTAISALQQMRESSPTGGALGNVTDYENRMLASTIAGLHNSQKTEDAEKALIRVKATFATMLQQRYEGKPGDDARFQADLARNIEEMSAEHQNKKAARGESKYKVTPREK